MNLIRLRSEFLLLIMAAYLILNHGAMLVRVPPMGSSGLPVGELLVLIFAATLAFEVRRAPSFGAVAPILPLFAWWGLAAFQLLIALPEHGFWAVRDASHVIESAFIWIGFTVAATAGFFDRFSKWLRAVLNIGAIYALLFPFRDILAQLSPKLQSPGGYSSPLFFNYFSAGLVPLTAAMSWLVDRKSYFGLPAIVLAGSLIVYSIVVFQMRTTYLQVAALIIVMIAIRPRVAVQMSAGMMLGFVALILLIESGIEITGRLGEKFSLDFLIQHISAIWGSSGDGKVFDAAQGVNQRLGWWLDIWRRLNESVQSLSFGLGYGIPLTDFNFSDGSRVREPHNSLVSIMARQGLVGLFFFVWFQIALLRVWIRTYRWCCRNGAGIWKNNMLIMGVFFLLLWMFSIGEDGFEKPYNAIVYYFLWGVILRVNYEILAPNGRFRRYFSNGFEGY